MAPPMYEKKAPDAEAQEGRSESSKRGRLSERLGRMVHEEEGPRKQFRDPRSRSAVQRQCLKDVEE